MAPAHPGPSPKMVAVFVFWLTIFWVPAAMGGTGWTYSGPHGQHHWPDTYPDCGGTAQSPINIQSPYVKYNQSLPPIEPVGYRSPGDSAFTLSNNGHSVKMSLPTSMFLRGLPKRYNAVQLHLHWGSSGHPGGSEHQLNGEMFAAELHIVHFNSERYTNASQAINKPDGLAVLGILIETGGIVNEPYNNILNFLENVEYAGDKVSIPTFDVHQLLPEKLDQFYRYQGSLTTPPCYQSVLWTVFHQTVQLAESQLKKLQGALYATGPESASIPLVDNVREIQMLHQRTVYASFPMGSVFRYSTGEVTAIVFGILIGLLGLFFIIHIIIKRSGGKRGNAQKDVVLKSSSTLPADLDANPDM